MNLSQYSQHRGVSVTAVEQAILAGRITRNQDGSIDVERADSEWQANTDPSERKTRKLRDPAISVQTGIKSSLTLAEAHRKLAENFDLEKLGKLPYSEARAIKENMNAKMAWVEVQKALSELLDRHEVASEIEKLFRVFRDACLNIPNRVAAQVANLTDLADVQDVIGAEIQQALNELSASLGRIAEGAE